MVRITSLPFWWRRLLIGLMCLGLAGIWWRLDQPNELVFDEHYHVLAARAVLQSDWRIFDWWQPPSDDGTYADWLHPPVFKYLQAGSMLILGDRPLAWRLSSAVAATGVIWLTFILARQVSKRSETGLLTAALAAMSGLVLVQSRTGMNDIVLTLFGLGAVVAYTQVRLLHSSSNARKWLLVTGLLLGLATATKWTGWLLAGGLLGLELWRQRAIWQRWPWIVISLFAVPALIYVIAFWPIWTTGRGWPHFVQLHRAIWQYQVTRDHDHPDQSSAWQWPLNRQQVWYWHGDTTADQTADIFAGENPLLNLILLAGVSAWTWQIFRAWRQQKKFPESTWVWWLYLVWWVPLLASPRILFQYHYLPTVPLAALLTALAIEPLYRRLTRVGWGLLGVILSLIGFVWILFYPHWTGLPVPLWLAQTIYS